MNFLNNIKRMQKFWSYVEKTDTCWNWRAGTNGKGYGRFWDGYKMLSCTSIVWWLISGEFPTKDVLHKCDNPSCVRPDHLFLGTKKDNAQDMIKKGRSGCIGFVGEDHYKAKLTEKEVLEIKELYKQGGISHRTLGIRYGVSAASIGYLIRGKNWSYLGGIQ